MNNEKVGQLIRTLRKEKHMTQLALARKLNISDKTVSKWERGRGAPELSLIEPLSQVFQVDPQSLISGELPRNEISGGNMKKMKYYICPDCGNLITALADAEITCCGRKLAPAEPVKAYPEEKLSVELIDTDYFVSTDHPMTKEHYITFVALQTGDTLVLKKQYPEWDLQVRIPRIARGKLIWCCNRHGLFYQYV